MSSLEKGAAKTRPPAARVMNMREQSLWSAGLTGLNEAAKELREGKSCE